MKEFFVDLRCGDIKILVLNGQDIVFSLFNENFSFDNKQKNTEIFNHIKRECGVYPSNINLILPDEEFIIKEILVPKVSLADSEKIIFRKLCSELKVSELKFFYRLLRSEEKGNIFLVQTINPEKIIYYEKKFKEYGIRIKKVTSAFLIDLAISEEFSKKSQNIIVDIDRNSINLIASFKQEIMKYQLQVIPKIEYEKELEKGITIDRLIKRQIYAITDTIYNFHISFQQEFSDAIIDKYLIFGSALKLYEGLDLALKDALSQKSEFINERLEKDFDFNIFITLYYYSQVSDSIFNFYEKKRLIKILNETKFYSSLIIFCFVAFAFFVEYLNFLNKTRIRNLKTEYENSAKELKAVEMEQKGVNDIIKKRIPHYLFLKELANKLPENVYVERVVYTQSSKDNFFECQYYFPYSKELSNTKILTNIYNTFSDLKWLKIKGEPEISKKMINKEQFLTIKITYGIENYEK